MADPICELGKLHSSFVCGRDFLRSRLLQTAVRSGADATAKIFEQYGIAPGATWATVLGIVELIGGVALVAGLFTRYVAVVFSIVMAGAIFAVHMQYGFFLPNGVEFAFALLAANLTLLVGGPGALAVDGWLARRGMFSVHRHEYSIRQAA